MFPKNDRKRFAYLSHFHCSLICLALSLILTLPCLFPVVFSRPMTTGSIAMLRVICGPSFKFLMPRWQNQSLAIYPGGQTQAGAGWMLHLLEADYRSTQTLIKLPALKGDGINLQRQEGCVSLYSPHCNGCKGAKLVWVRPPEGGSANQQGKLKW